jgi:hypothetical protein
MKRIFWMTFLALGAAALGGCPIYPDSGSHRYCDNTGCYDCPTDGYTSSCVGWQCTSDAECPSGYSCGSSGYCINGAGPDGGIVVPPPGSCSSSAGCPTGQSCGANNQCAPGDCTNNGCPAPLVCKLTPGSGPQCVSLGDGGHPVDSGVDSPPFSGCHNDSECIALGPGAKCLDGTCVAASDQCWDTTQCPNNESCVNGVCTPGCDGTHPCPTGYSCSVSDGGTSGVCSGNPNPCGSSGETCPANTTCVDQHCVPPCSPTGTCPTGEVCVDNGCVPDQKPNPFVCSVDGQAGQGTPSAPCQVGSICLHHGCYKACDPEAGNSCATFDPKYNVCRSVASTSGSYYVCSSPTNLGGQCDPTAGKACPISSEICIDGYCR